MDNNDVVRIEMLETSVMFGTTLDGRIITAGNDDLVRFWTVRNGQLSEEKSYYIPISPIDDISSVDDLVILVCDNSLEIWEHERLLFSTTLASSHVVGKSYIAWTDVGSHWTINWIEVTDRRRTHWRKRSFTVSDPVTLLGIRDQYLLIKMYTSLFITRLDRDVTTDFFCTYSRLPLHLQKVAFDQERICFLDLDYHLVTLDFSPDQKPSWKQPGQPRKISTEEIPILPQVYKQPK
eukprot:TRINITY_DN4314_c0_g2_i1.p1 TRINITY_DN4314_c0_g2~~TRINITY_DN4314_c0_g2_i1.p1  ORF type:complete len:236 (+),score=11.77 TRINITY_DN4314_c0_g2_i1:487-1194(+)